MMEQHELNEVRLQRGDERIVLRRGLTDDCGHVHMPPGMAPMAMPVPAPPPSAAAVPAAASPAPTSELTGTVLKSPTIGTFYQSPSPGEAAFVKVGDRVKPDTIVCIIEAMKVFNPIPAKLSGTIVKVLAKDGDPVDFNQPLFLLSD